MVKIKINNLNNSLARQQFELQKNNLNKNEINKIKKELKSNGVGGAGSIDQDKSDKIEAEAQKFTAIFLEKMFSEMKNTLADEKILDGGFAEDVFSDMLTKEYSQLAGQQGILGELNRALVNQLKNS